MDNVYLLIGGNLGNRKKNLELAVGLIAERIGIIELQSSVYECSPWGNTNQPNFLNQVLVCKTTLTPYQILNQIQATEISLERVRAEKWGARTIDIDILFYDDIILKDKNLTIPHPLMQERKFALAPLNEIVPQLIHPVLNTTIEKLYFKCVDESNVELYEFEEDISENLISEFTFSMDSFIQITQGDEEFIEKMLAAYSFQTPISIELLAKAIAENDFETTAHISHKLKPTFMMFSVNSLNVDLEIIEKYARQKNNMPKISKIFQNMLPTLKKVYEKWQDLSQDFDQKIS
jgi:2-amino-4-hydroxy-6-hydroxymethyldihydropteridine diphosphokinase